MFKYKSAIVALFALTVVLGSCAATGSSSQKSEVYNQEFNKMVNVVERAIRGRNLSIEYAERSDDGNSYTILFGQRALLGNESVQQDLASVTIIRVDDNRTRIEIENPDYHYSVPSQQRKDYKRIITTRIKDILNN